METIATNTIDRNAMLQTVQMLHQVQKRMAGWGYRPVTHSDKPKLGHVLLRVQVQRYALHGTASDAPGNAPGTEFKTLHAGRLTPEGLEDIFRVNFDPSKPSNNDFRWFVKNSPRR